jgi:phenazine biosynthesis protein phzE
MSRVTHTEFRIEGETDRQLEDVLVQTMFAPAVTGSPIRNACRVIARHERHGRSYYAGYLALIQPDDDSTYALDSAINIRSAQVRRRGAEWTMRTDVGATLVRDSSPHRELAETHAKAAAILSAVCAKASPGVDPRLFDRPEPPAADDPDLTSALAVRRADTSSLWLRGESSLQHRGTRRRHAVLVDAEDDFTRMLAHQLGGFGYAVEVVANDHAVEAVDSEGLLIFGPGPGDPGDDLDPRVGNLTQALEKALASSRPFLAVCLSHQILARTLGLPLRRLPVPNQGTARTVDWFGRSVRLGFYNAFAAVRADGQPATTHNGIPFQVAADSDGHVTGLTANSFISMQFHPESALSVDGTAVLADSLARLER